MMTKKSPKISANFVCNLCTYKCSKLSEYSKHLMTTKHKRMTNDYADMSKISISYDCNCGKKYKYRQGLHGHKQKCKHIDTVVTIPDSQTYKEERIDYTLMFLESISHNKELINLLQSQSTTMLEQSKTIQNILPKIGSNNNNNNQTIISLIYKYF